MLFFLTTCDENPLSMKRTLSGTWSETYFQNMVNMFGKVDSIHATVISFDKNNFTVTRYDDSIPNEYDTTYTGTYSANSDTIYFYPGDFSEVYKLAILSNGNMLLNKMYSLDPNGVKLGDFDSILWCTQAKRYGIFIPN